MQNTDPILDGKLYSEWAREYQANTYKNRRNRDRKDKRDKDRISQFAAYHRMKYDIDKETGVIRFILLEEGTKP